MATPTLAKPQTPEHSQPVYDGQLIDGLTDLVSRVEQPKPPQPETDERDRRKEQNAAMLLDAWAQGEKMNLQAFEIPTRKKLDPLTIALNGYPDVNTYYAEREGY